MGVAQIQQYQIGQRCQPPGQDGQLVPSVRRVGIARAAGPEPGDGPAADISSIVGGAATRCSVIPIGLSGAVQVNVASAPETATPRYRG